MTTNNPVDQDTVDAMGTIANHAMASNEDRSLVIGAAAANLIRGAATRQSVDAWTWRNEVMGDWSSLPASPPRNNRELRERLDYAEDRADRAVAEVIALRAEVARLTSALADALGRGAAAPALGGKHAT